MITLTYSLYVLCDPITKAIRYVGISTKPAIRFREHCKSGRGGAPRSHKEKWIAKLWQAGLVPLFILVDEGLNLKTAKIREQDLIATLPKLTNGTAGG